MNRITSIALGPKGKPCEIECNGSHDGLNIIGATEILKDHKFYHRSYPAKETIKAPHVKGFLDRLLNLYEGKELYVIPDNSRAHKAILKEYGPTYRGKCHLMPPYSPELNPQENMWCWLKDYCAQGRAYSVVKELSNRICKFQVYTYNTPSKVRKRVDARLYFKAS